MPVRSLNSSVLAWPRPDEVDAAVRRWASTIPASRLELRRLGYFGSYARGDWGVGSDLDLIAIVTSAEKRFEQRPLGWDLNSLPVPAEILVYTEDEWTTLLREGSRFARALERETVWVFPP